jgi:hypothetical protein
MDAIWPWRGDRPQNLVNKVRALHRKDPSPTFEVEKHCLDQFYTYLTVLDSKATGLLTVNTLFIAILVGFLTADASKVFDLQIPFSKTVAELQLLGVFFSALLCLFVVSVSWNFLANVPTEPQDAKAFEAELKRLANVIDDRTHYYWFAWVLTLLALVATVAWWSFCVAGIVAVVVGAWLWARS